MSKRTQQFGVGSFNELPIEQGMGYPSRQIDSGVSLLDTETGESAIGNPYILPASNPIGERNSDISGLNRLMAQKEVLASTFPNVRVVNNREDSTVQGALDSILDATASKKYAVFAPNDKYTGSWTPKTNVSVYDLSALATSADGTFTNPTITGGTMTTTVLTSVTINNSTIGLTSLPVHDCVYHDQITIDQQNATGSSLWPMGNVTGNTAIGQVYPSGVSKQLTHCEFVITRVGNPTDAVYVSLLNTTAGAPSGASRINSDLLQARDIQDGVVNSFYFPRYAPSSNTGNWQLSGTSYAIALFRTGAVDANNYYNISYDNGGQGTAYLYNGSAWGSPFGAFVFTTYYGETTQTNIALSQLDPSNGILNVQNLGTGTLTSGAVLTVPASGNVPAWSTTLSVTGLTLNGTAITATGTEINYTDGVTAAIQTQLDARVLYTGATANVDLGAYNLTANIVISDSFQVGNPANSYSTALSSQANATNKIVVFPNYSGTILLNQQVILASEDADATPYTVSANVTMVYDTYAATQLMYLPSGLANNKVYIIKNTNASASCNIYGQDGETINGTNPYWLYAGDSVILIKSGTDWRPVSEYDNTSYQPSDAGLTDIAALAVTDGNIIVGDGANWVAESGATARTSLGLAIGTNIPAINETMYIGTTSMALNRASAAQTLAGLTLTTPTFTGNITQNTGTTFTNTATLDSSTNILTDYLADGTHYRTAIVSKTGGTGNAIEVSTGNILQNLAPTGLPLGSTNVTARIWVRPTSIGNDKLVLFFGLDGTANATFVLLQRGTPTAYWAVATYGYGLNSTAQPTTNEWWCVIGKWTSTTATIKTRKAGDGAWVTVSSAKVPNRQNNTLCIGGVTNGVAVGAGKLDEPQIWAEITSDASDDSYYNSGSGEYGSAGGNLVSAWHLDEASGTADDYATGSPNDLSVYGSPTYQTGLVLTPAADVTRDAFRFTDPAGVKPSEAGILSIGDLANGDSTIKLCGRNIICGNEAVLAVAATTGFLYIPAMDGAPTGVPEDYTGKSAVVHDRTNNRIYFYDHASDVWAYAGLT